MGRRRVLRRRGSVRGHGSGLFKPPRWRYLADIVSFVNPEEARGSVLELKKQFENAKTRDKRLRIIRAAIYAANRAKAIAERHPNISDRERHELLEVSEIYRECADELLRKYHRLYG